MSGGWFDDEAIEQERWDADLEMAQFEAEGRRYAALRRKSEAARAAGDLAAAAEACPHSGGYPLKSLAAEYANDPGQGQEGWRCSDCGSRLAALYGDGKVLIPCEVGGHA